MFRVFFLSRSLFLVSLKSLSISCLFLSCFLFLASRPPLCPFLFLSLFPPFSISWSLPPCVFLVSFCLVFCFLPLHPLPSLFFYLAISCISDTPFYFMFPPLCFMSLFAPCTISSLSLSPFCFMSLFVPLSLFFCISPTSPFYIFLPFYFSYLFLPHFVFHFPPSLLSIFHVPFPAFYLMPRFPISISTPFFTLFSLFTPLFISCLILPHLLFLVSFYPAFYFLSTSPLSLFRLQTLLCFGLIV